ncbi:MAG: pilus assembly PilX N-terminal domain-containing protein [Acidobacteria bacterium]|nr:pilus assembly PilX N-terminal domain-containing protein [Acidobacteriota bacterium]
MKHNLQNGSSVSSNRDGEKGSAIVIALFVLVLLAGFVALATTRTASEAMSVANETAEGRALYAAQGSLEMMTRRLNNHFGKKLRATTSDLDAIRDPSQIQAVDGFDRYEFDQKIGEIGMDEDQKYTVITGGPFSGLFAGRDHYRLSTTVTDPNGIEVELARNVIANRIPIFQFGIFYDDDLELFRPPLFSFGGRVHSNRHFFLSPGSEGVYFDSRITAAGHIVTESWRTGYSGDNYNATYIKDAYGDFQLLNRNEGSVRNGAGNILRNEPTPKCTAVEDFPGSINNAGWSTAQAKFGGNLVNRAPELRLPLKIGTDCDSMGDLIEILKRPKNIGTDLAVTAATKNNLNPQVLPVTAANADDEIMKESRYANKRGIRVSIADSKRRLPGCAAANATDRCGKNLLLGMGSGSTDVNARVARMMKSSFDATNYEITPLNAQRFDDELPGLPTSEAGPTGIWVKVEAVGVDDTTGDIISLDITEEFLSLGVTDLPSHLRVFNTSTGNCSTITANRVCFNNETGSLTDNGSPTAPSAELNATTAQSPYTFRDTRSIIKMQRYDIPGRTDSNYRLSTTNLRTGVGSDTGAGEKTIDGQRFYYWAENVSPYSRHAYIRQSSGAYAEHRLLPFPIKMFDGREGLYYDNRSTTADGDTFNLPRNGVMSMVDIDVANLRRFLRGDFDGLFPAGTVFEEATGNTLRGGDIPQDGGWVLYVSDRRGDYDFDGEYDMEDVYGPNDGILQSGEDANADGFLNERYGREAERYRGTNSRRTPEEAAFYDHRYYRRGIRLINGTVLPGIYDSATQSNTKGFTVASENGVYVKGNYNATGLSVAPPSNANSPYNNYRPFDTANHIPASIVADAVTILSNAWNDSQSFRTALEPSNPSQSRVASNTTIRFAMISGDTIATRLETPNQGSTASGERTNGGVHNFKRFLEHWSGQRLDYAGSLINLFNSRNNSTPFKCCALVYNPPRRNWVFDSTFLNPNRLPPGTPYFHYVQTTGFMRTNE